MTQIPRPQKPIKTYIIICKYCHILFWGGASIYWKMLFTPRGEVYDGKIQPLNFSINHILKKSEPQKINFSIQIHTHYKHVPSPHGLHIIFERPHIPFSLGSVYLGGRLVSDDLRLGAGCHPRLLILPGSSRSDSVSYSALTHSVYAAKNRVLSRIHALN